MDNDIIQLKPTDDPEKTYYVLLCKDETHVYSFPDGSPYYTDRKQIAELYERILQKELKTNRYAVCELADALRRIGEKQAELEEAWLPTIRRIRQLKGVSDRRHCYQRAYRKLKMPHPLLYDNDLKVLLKLK